MTSRAYQGVFTKYWLISRNKRERRLKRLLSLLVIAPNGQQLPNPYPPCCSRRFPLQFCRFQHRKGKLRSFEHAGLIL